MSKEVEITNAVIESATLQYDRGIFLCGYLNLNFGGSGCFFGGYVLGVKPGHKAKAAGANETGILASWVNGVMTCADVEEYHKVRGRVVRVKREAGFNGKVIAIGHCVNDIWFEPEKEFARFRDDDGGQS